MDRVIESDRMRVIVVGAGIVGASIAYHLAAEGARVVVVDRADQGQATAAGAGVVFPWLLQGTPPGIAALGLRAAEHYPRLVEALLAAGVRDTGYVPVGGITVVEDGAVLDEMYKALLRLREQPGMAALGAVERLAAGEPAVRFPVLRGDLAGLYVGGVVRVDGGRMRDALTSAATGQGAEWRSGTASLTLDGSTVTGVAVDGETIGADCVVVAAGAWSRTLCEPLGLALPVFPQRGQILHLDLPGQHTESWPIVRAVDDHYLLAFPGGRVVVGATRESGVGFDRRVTARGLHQILTDALAIAPGLDDGTVAEVRVGFRPLSTDGAPLLGGIDGLSGLVVATGLGPIGLTLGPYLGAVAADLALGRDVPLDLTPYRPDRGTGAG